MTEALPADPRLKATTIGHADHQFLSPLSETRADWLIEMLGLPDGARVLDIGCGKAALLRRLLRQAPTARGTGVDINPAFLSEAASAAAREGVGDRLRLVEHPASGVLEDAKDVDVLLCLGASHAVGGFDALARMARSVLPSGGAILAGEGFWRRRPDADYLAVLGAEPEELTHHAENAARLRAAGFAVTATAAASDEEWDAYEGLYCRAKTRWALAHPEDPDAEHIASAAQRWHDAYLRWGRDTLGFGWYVGVAI